MIRVYLAEDSPTVAEGFRKMLTGDPALALAGWAPDGLRARADLPRIRPDILVTDLHMPGLDGFELIRWVMAHQPLPVLVLSNTARERGSDLAFRCLEAGAAEIGPKPRGGEHFERDRAELCRLLRVLAGVRVVGRRPAPVRRIEPARERPRVVAIGASTGGPQALQRLLGGLSPKFPAPILVAQHMADGFLDGLVAWLSRSTPVPALVARSGMAPEPGRAHFAPEGWNLLLARDGRLELRAAAGDLAPSADALFRSLALGLGAGGCGVLLTGMGRDGAQGLLAMRRAGACTIAQAPGDCLVGGMPGAAVALGAAGSVLALDLIAPTLRSLCP